MTVHRVLAATGALIVLMPSAHSWADDAPAPPPQHTWIGKGQFGFLQSKGNSDAESINGSIDMSRYDDDWKNAFTIVGLYGKSAGLVAAERWEVREQTNYTFTPNTFAFGGFRYEHDLFDGFQYQASVTTGIGYKIFDTDTTKLTAQVGAGYRRLRPEIIDKDPVSGAVISRTPLDASGEAIGTIGVDLSHKLHRPRR
jgi:putative salt-induced outer membrane protein